jgi:hypothetical protein
MEPSPLPLSVRRSRLPAPRLPQPLVEEFVRRINDPQDLEYGLLAVAHAAMLDDVQKQARADEERALFEPGNTLPPEPVPSILPG